MSKFNLWRHLIGYFGIVGIGEKSLECQLNKGRTIFLDKAEQVLPYPELCVRWKFVDKVIDAFTRVERL